MNHPIALTDEYIRASFSMQLSGYFSGVAKGPEGVEYYYSELLTSSSWNKALFADLANARHVEFVRRAAAVRGRSPSFFVREDELPNVQNMVRNKFRVERERWMICEVNSLVKGDALSSASLRFTTGPSPSSEFCMILSALFLEEERNNRFIKYYIPTLARARPVGNINIFHATLNALGKPVSCGSIYVIDGIAGLFNVGTIASHQGKGYGRIISHGLVEKAFMNGASRVLLQCVVGTHVERLYSRIGFQSAEVPGIVTLD